MKTLLNFTAKGGGTSYTAPTIETLNVSIEKGFGDSAFGEEGAAGGDVAPGNDYDL